MIEPKSNGKTMKQLKAYWKSSKGTNKSYWAGRIDGLKGRVFPYVQRVDAPIYVEGEKKLYE